MDITFAKLVLAAKLLPVKEWRDRYQEELYAQWATSKNDQSPDEKPLKFTAWAQVYYDKCLEYLSDRGLH